MFVHVVAHTQIPASMEGYEEGWEGSECAENNVNQFKMDSAPKRQSFWNRDLLKLLTRRKSILMTPQEVFFSFYILVISHILMGFHVLHFVNFFWIIFLTL